jgi:hypothetical protein
MKMIICQVYVVLITATVLMSSCASMTPADTDAQKEFTFDFSVPGKSQTDLWHNARDFFAEAYGDSRSVFRVMDEKDATIIGKGIALWNIGLPGAYSKCQTEYHIRFAAKNDKARLQYEIIYGVPALSSCTGWPWPSKDGYAEIVAGFKNSAGKLETALKGAGTINKLKDF